MQKDRWMRFFQMVCKLSLVFETHIVFYNCIFCSCFSRVSMASDFFFQDGTISLVNLSSISHSRILIHLSIPRFHSICLKADLTTLQHSRTVKRGENRWKIWCPSYADLKIKVVLDSHHFKTVSHEEETSRWVIIYINAKKSEKNFSPFFGPRGRPWWVP